MSNVYKNIIGMIFFATALILGVSFSSVAYADSISVRTDAATSIGERSAILNGFVSNPDGRSNAYFEWGGSGITETQTSASAYTGNTTFRATVIGLLPGRTYYFRAVAISKTTGEKVFGETINFTTGQKQFLSQQTPTIETRTATDVTGVSAVLNGAVNPQGSTDTMRWFEWGTTQSLGKQTPKANQGTTAGNFSYSISDLTPDTIYYYKAVAQNANGVVSGSVYSFRTGGLNYLPTTPVSTSAKPIVITLQPKVVSEQSAVLAGTAFPSATVATQGWFEWGKTNALGNKTLVQNIGSAASINYSQELPSLSSNTTYYYRAVIENERGKAEGIILSFRTGSGGVVGGGTAKPANGTKPTETKTTNGTAAAGGVLSQCLPNSLIGWLIIVLIIILIMIAIDHLVDRYKKRKEAKKRLNEMKENEEPRIIK